MAALLWGGLGVLTIALLVLMRTRWGQAQPLSKCVGLSVFAHLLFLTFAYGTHLFDPIPGPVEDPIRMRWLGAEQDTELEETEAPEDAPWDAASDLDPGNITDLVGVPQPTTTTAPMAAEQARNLIAEPPEAPAPIAASNIPEMRANREAMAKPATGGDSESIPPVRSGPQAMAADVLAVDLAPPAPMNDSDVAPDSHPEQKSPAEIAAADSPATPHLPATDLEAERTEFAHGDQGLALDEATLSQLAEIAQGPDRLESRSALDPVQQVRRSWATLPTRSGMSGGSRPMRLGDGQPMPQPYEARMGDRLATAVRYGGDGNTEQAVNAALRWLSSTQSSDGRWETTAHGGGRETMVYGHHRGGAGMQADTGITGLALLAFLASGHTQLEGEYRQVVARGLEFLQRSQSGNGDLAGSARPFARMYCHGMAFLALSEAYGMTGDPQLARAVRAAADFTTASQNASTGGWRYMPQDRGDTSQFGWQAMSLRSAELSGIAIGSATRQRMAMFLDSVTLGPNRGLAAYRPQEAPSPTMTAEALASRTLLHLPINALQLDEGVRYIVAHPPIVGGKLNLYGMYYGSLALFQQQGDAWDRWNRMMKETLLLRQVTQGPQSGSWPQDTLWGGYGGQVYSTAMATMCLEVYYRYLPLYAASGPLASRP